MDAIIAAVVFNTLSSVVNSSSFRSSRAVSWERVAPAILVGRVLASFSDVSGRSHAGKISFRIDGRAGRGKGYRVDVKTESFSPWEAIDGMAPARTIADAKKLVQVWLAGGSKAVAA